jgi:glutathione S-transferase
MKLYYAANSCALACHIALEEAGADYEAAKLDMRNGDLQRPEYLAINPKGRVPALVTAEGVLTETPAILAFVANAFPGSQLAPLDNDFSFARVHAFNIYLCSTVHVAHAHGYRGYRWADDDTSLADMRQKLPRTMGACFELIETSMLVGPFVMGEAYTICDPYLFTMARYAQWDGVEIERFPKVSEHVRLMLDRPAVRKVLAMHT